MQPTPDLSNLPLTAPKDGMPLTVTEFLSGIQLVSSINDLLVSFPASMYEGEESVPANTRIPAHWTQQIEEIRDQIGGVISNRQLWKTRGDFYRWCIAMGLKLARDIGKMLNEEGTAVQLNPILEMQNFIERTQGELVARTQAMQSARNRAKEIGEGIQDLVLRAEPEEAAEILLKYAEGLTQLSSPFWRRYSMEVLIASPGVAKILCDLIEDDHITDEVLVGMYDELKSRALRSEDTDDGIDTIDPDE